MLYGLSENIDFPVFPCALQLLFEDKLEGEAKLPLECYKLLVSHGSST